MNKDKHISEIAKILVEYEDCGDCQKCKYHNSCGEERIATNLYNADYRKQVWISVEERLPESEGTFLVWNKEQKKIEIRFFYRLPPDYPVESHPEIREYFGNFADYKRITHWMPLPEAPKMKGGE